MKKSTIGLTVLCLFMSSAAVAFDCIPTPHRTTGTHYEPVIEHKIDISRGLKVSGRVLAMPDCKPVADAKVAHWQAGEDGRYSDRLRAYLFTNTEGQFAFESEWPNLSPPHIHFIVTAKGFDVLETQWIGRSRQDSIDFTMVLEERSGQ